MPRASLVRVVVEVGRHGGCPYVVLFDEEMSLEGVFPRESCSFNNRRGKCGKIRSCRVSLKVLGPLVCHPHARLTFLATVAGIRLDFKVDSLVPLEIVASMKREGALVALEGPLLAALSFPLSPGRFLGRVVAQRENRGRDRQGREWRWARVGEDGRARRQASRSAEKREVAAA